MLLTGRSRDNLERTAYLAFGKPTFGDEEVAAVERVVRSGWIGMGQETITFEHELADACGVPQVVTVNSCTSALFLALLVLGVGSGDEVICPSMTWCSSANAALYLGAKPVFCDIAPDTLSVSVAAVKAKITPQTKAVIVVHYGGLAMEVEALRAILPSGVAIVEDAAHAFGARFANGAPVGGSGNLTCFSFYANKNLATGEGGAIALTDDALAQRLRMLRLHGLPTDAWQRFTNPTSAFSHLDLHELGYKMNYTDLQAALGRVQLRRQSEFAERRENIAKYYHNIFSEQSPSVSYQTGVIEKFHARHLFVILLPEEYNTNRRDNFVSRLRKIQIGASIHYRPLHLMPLYGTQEPLPVTERVAQRIVTLPISASMTLDDAQDVVDAVLSNL